MGKWRFVLGAVLLACMGLAFAAGRGEMRKQAELSMLLGGSIDIERDGSVGMYTLDDTAKLPQAATALLDKATGRWRFEPVLIDGKAVRARTAMSVRLVARPREGSNEYDVRIAAVNFGTPQPDEFVSSNGPLKRPAYPHLAVLSGVRGTVYVIVRIGRDGKVEDAMAEQVNLRVIDSEGGMKRWRDMLTEASLRVARQWKFVPPTKGEEVDAPFWLARVPVDYLFPGDKVSSNGEWQAYIPGPRQTAPWLGGFDTSLGADAVAGGGIFPLKGGPRLLTPLDEG